MSRIHQTDKLLSSPEPLTDESFMGYLLRLTELNRCETVSWILSLAGIKNFFQNKLSFVFNSSLNLGQLAVIADVDESELVALTYRPADMTGVRVRNYLVLGNAVPQYFINLRYPKICPPCLLESNYIQRIWELAPLTACVKHQCLLLDECPSCDKRISWSRQHVACCKCEFDWREYSPPQVESSELEVALRIHHLCGLPVGTVTGSKRVDANPLAQLSLSSFLSSLCFIAGQSVGIVDTVGKYLMPSRSNSEIHILLSRAYEVFNNWPANFFAFLEQRREKVNRAKTLRGWSKEFGQYRNALYRQLAGREFDYMRDAFEEYLSTQWDGGYASVTTRLGPKARQSRKYISKKEAVNLLNLSSQSIENMLYEGKLKGIARSYNKSRLILIEKESAVQWQLVFERAVDIKEVEKILGITRKRIMQLVDSNMLSPVRGPQIDGSHCLRFKKEEVADLRSGLICSLTKSHHTQDVGDQLSWNNSLRKLRRADIDFSAFIKAVLNKEIVPSGKTDGLGVTGLLFSSKQVSNFVQKVLHNQASEMISIQEACETLKMPDTSIRFLIKRKFLNAKKLRGLQALGLLMAKSELESFNKRYVFIGKIASALNTTATHLVRLLRELSISPVSGVSIDGGFCYVFKKTDLSSVSLKSLIEARKTLQKMSRKSLFDEAQAAQALGLDSSSLHELIQDGTLKPLRRRCEKELRFTRYSIEKYKQQYAHRELVSASAAAKALNISKGRFLTAFIYTGRLKATLRVGKRGCYFFEKRVVESLAQSNNELKSKTINSVDAAHIFGVNPSCIHKMIDNGTLKPVRGPRIDGSAFYLFLRSEIEELYQRRESFKDARLREGGSSRFGAPVGRRQCPTLSKVSRRIDQLIQKCKNINPSQQVTGSLIHKQLIKEGHKVGTTTVYNYLRRRDKTITAGCLTES